MPLCLYASMLYAVWVPGVCLYDVCRMGMMEYAYSMPIVWPIVCLWYMVYSTAYSMPIVYGL